MSLQNSQDTGGPFIYLNMGKWDDNASFNLLCSNKEAQTPIIKLRGGERNFISNNKIECNKKTAHPMVYKVVHH